MATIDMRLGRGLCLAVCLSSDWLALGSFLGFLFKHFLPLYKCPSPAVWCITYPPGLQSNEPSFLRHSISFSHASYVLFFVAHLFATASLGSISDTGNSVSVQRENIHIFFAVDVLKPSELIETTRMWNDSAYFW